MIDCATFYRSLLEQGVDFFTGVPDSLLKDFNAYVMDNADPSRHIIAANEGGAVALAAGHHLATNNIGLVYMQNSGQGNAVNPLTSLVDPEVYSIPLLLLIGWRGEPGVHDEPQHVKQGRITLGLLDTLEIPYEILPDETSKVKDSLERAVSSIRKRGAPYAILVKKGTFAPYQLKKRTEAQYGLSREDALKRVIGALDAQDTVVSTTGMLSRELFEHREALQEGHGQDFLTVGSMGHSSQIALGVALARPDRVVYALDGDGAVIMHMGALAIIGSQKPKNFRHVVFNNGAHDSVGGQPTAGFQIDIPSMARACGYKAAWVADSPESISKMMVLLRKSEGPALLEIRVNKGSRKDLGRPTSSPVENKREFMKNMLRSE